jgi:hypothetical protein
MLIILLFLFIENLTRLVRGFSDVYWFLGMFIVRTVAWSIGLVVGVYKLFKLKV